MKNPLLHINLLIVSACQSAVNTDETPPPGTQIGSEDAVPEEDSGVLSNNDTVEDTSNSDTDIVSYDIEDKWLWSPSEFREHANTMYEYVDGIRYISYADCWPDDCTDADFYELEEADRIPGTHSYTWDEDTQTIFDEDGNASAVTFECDGGIVYFPNGVKLWRLSSNCE